MSDQKQPVSANLWIASYLIGLSSFMLGYALVSLNSCLVTGDKNSGDACFNGDDDGNPSCPQGSIYVDLNLTTCKKMFSFITVCLK